MCQSMSFINVLIWSWGVRWGDSLLRSAHFCPVLWFFGKSFEWTSRQWKTMALLLSTSYLSRTTKQLTEQLTGQLVSWVLCLSKNISVPKNLFHNRIVLVFGMSSQSIIRLFLTIDIKTKIKTLLNCLELSFIASINNLQTIFQNMYWIEFYRNNWTNCLQCLQSSQWITWFFDTLVSSQSNHTNYEFDKHFISHSFIQKQDR